MTRKLDLDYDGVGFYDDVYYCSGLLIDGVVFNFFCRDYKFTSTSLKIHNMIWFRKAEDHNYLPDNNLIYHVSNFNCYVDEYFCNLSIRKMKKPSWWDSALEKLSHVSHLPLPYTCARYIEHCVGQTMQSVNPVSCNSLPIFSGSARQQDTRILHGGEIVPMECGPGTLDHEFFEDNSDLQLPPTIEGMWLNHDSST